MPAKLSSVTDVGSQAPSFQPYSVASKKVPSPKGTLIVPRQRHCGVGGNVW